MHVELWRSVGEGGRKTVRSVNRDSCRNMSTGPTDSIRPEESHGPRWCITHTNHNHTHKHIQQSVPTPSPAQKPSFPADIYAVSLFNVARLRLWWLVAAPSPCVSVFPFDKARGERKSASPTPRHRPRVPVGGVFLAAAVATTCDSRSTWQESILVNSPCASPFDPTLILDIFTSTFTKDPRQPFTNRIKTRLMRVFLPKASHTHLGKISRMCGHVHCNELAHNTSPKKSLPTKSPPTLYSED